MRIIAGSRKGHKLMEFDGMKVRPTTDRVKESMFNLIQDYIAGGTILDLFAGTGALTFEALSRGACRAVCTDIDINSINIIRKNADALNFANLEIVNKDAQSYIKSSAEKFSVIFLDPPYNKGFIKPVVEDILKYSLLDDNGIIVLESDSVDEHDEISGLEIIKQRKYGRTYITVYQRG